MSPSLQNSFLQGDFKETQGELSRSFVKIDWIAGSYEDSSLSHGAGRMNRNAGRRKDADGLEAAMAERCGRVLPSKPS
jgi:hypothetical protein